MAGGNLIEILIELRERLAESLEVAAERVDRFGGQLRAAAPEHARYQQGLDRDAAAAGRVTTSFDALLRKQRDLASVPAIRFGTAAAQMAAAREAAASLGAALQTLTQRTAELNAQQVRTAESRAAATAAVSQAVLRSGMRTDTGEFVSRVDREQLAQQVVAGTRELPEAAAAATPAVEAFRREAQALAELQQQARAAAVAAVQLREANAAVAGTGVAETLDRQRAAVQGLVGAAQGLASAEVAGAEAGAAARQKETTAVRELTASYQDMLELARRVSATPALHRGVLMDPTEATGAAPPGELEAERAAALAKLARTAIPPAQIEATRKAILEAADVDALAGATQKLRTLSETYTASSARAQEFAAAHPGVVEAMRQTQAAAAEEAATIRALGDVYGIESAQVREFMSVQEQSAQRARSLIARMAGLRTGIGAGSATGLGGAVRAGLGQALVFGGGGGMAGLATQQVAEGGGAAAGAAGVAAAGVAGLVASVEIIKHLAEEARKLGETGRDIENFASKTGIAVADMQALAVAAKDLGVPTANLAFGLRFFNRNLSQNDETLAALGITTRDTKQALIQLADVFSRSEDGPAKVEIAMKLLGRSGSELIPLLDEGGAAVRGYMERLRGLGATFETNVLPSMHRLHETALDNEHRWEALRIQAATLLIPAMQAAADAVNTTMRALGGVSDIVAIATRSLRSFSDAVPDAVKSLAGLSIDFSPWHLLAGAIDDSTRALRENRLETIHHQAVQLAAMAVKMSESEPEGPRAPGTMTSSDVMRGASLALAGQYRDLFKSLHPDDSVKESLREVNDQIEQITESLIEAKGQRFDRLTAEMKGLLHLREQLAGKEIDAQATVERAAKIKQEREEAQKFLDAVKKAHGELTTVSAEGAFKDLYVEVQQSAMRAQTATEALTADTLAFQRAGGNPVQLRAFLKVDSDVGLADLPRRLRPVALRIAFEKGDVAAMNQQLADARERLDTLAGASRKLDVGGMLSAAMARVRELNPALDKTEALAEAVKVVQQQVEDVRLDAEAHVWAMRLGITTERARELADEIKNVVAAGAKLGMVPEKAWLFRDELMARSKGDAPETETRQRVPEGERERDFTKEFGNVRGTGVGKTVEAALFPPHRENALQKFRQQMLQIRESINLFAQTARIAFDGIGNVFDRWITTVLAGGNAFKIQFGDIMQQMVADALSALERLAEAKLFTFLLSLIPGVGPAGATAFGSAGTMIDAPISVPVGGPGHAAVADGSPAASATGTTIINNYVNAINARSIADQYLSPSGDFRNYERRQAALVGFG